MSETDEGDLDLDARYGTRRRGPLRSAALIGLTLVLTAAVGFAGWRLGNPPVTYRLLAFRVVSADRVDVTFELRRPTQRSVVCVLRAQDEQRVDVAYATVTVGPGGDYTQPTVPLATRARATVAEVLGCGLDAAPPVPPPDFPPGSVNPPQVRTVPGA